MTTTPTPVVPAVLLNVLEDLACVGAEYDEHLPWRIRGLVDALEPEPQDCSNAMDHPDILTAYRDGFARGSTVRALLLARKPLIPSAPAKQ